MGPKVFLGALTGSSSTFSLSVFTLCYRGPLYVLVQGLPQFKNLMVWKQEFSSLPRRAAFPRAQFSGGLSTSSCDLRSRRSDLQIQKIPAFWLWGRKACLLNLE